jgi:hypothetical protein
MRLKTLLAVTAIALVSATFLLADEWNRRVEVTFSHSVALPPVHQEGLAVLAPGTYVFKIMDSQSNRHIVQVFNKDENEIYATILAIPNVRLEPTDKVVITFRETPAGQPFALRAMFYPGRTWGEEFVYPKAKAVELAKATKEPVLATPSEIELPPAAPELIAQLENAPVTAVEPSGQEVQTAEVVTPPAPIARPELPKTASPMPLAGLIGLLALTTGLILRFAEKRF